MTIPEDLNKIKNRAKTLAQDSFLRASTLRERFVTTRSLLPQLLKVGGVRLSTETVCQRPRKADLVF